ncbi:hypothetical protein QF025_002676 [Paraburkholderia graminis]|uniref:Uncharacterized protein n=1 Tax=Paraburkholderia graminis TaxID=60548 RepID=A0ABD5CGE2_9BURK|nr:hypothetical protein [Paraburkholderia graminis]
MTQPLTKLPVKRESEGTERPWSLQAWQPIESLRREIDRLLEDCDRGFHSSPFRRSGFYIEPFPRRAFAWTTAPAVDKPLSRAGC